MIRFWFFVSKNLFPKIHRKHNEWNFQWKPSLKKLTLFIENTMNEMLNETLDWKSWDVSSEIQWMKCSGKTFIETLKKFHWKRTQNKENWTKRLLGRVSKPQIWICFYLRLGDWSFYILFSCLNFVIQNCFSIFAFPSPTYDIKL